VNGDLGGMLVREGFSVLAGVGGPVLGALLIIGLVFGVIQAATQINDPAVGFLPRLAGGLLVVLLAGNWIMERLSKYLVLAFSRIAGGQ
jgi:flagellar biosynthesis protein FliQ